MPVPGRVVVPDHERRRHEGQARSDAAQDAERREQQGGLPDVRRQERPERYQYGAGESDDTKPLRPEQSDQSGGERSE